MALLERKHLLKFKSELEKNVLEDFGEKGLANLKKTDIRLNAPINDQFELKIYEKHGLRRSIKDSSICGKIYYIFSREVKGIFGKDIETELQVEGDIINFYATIDLDTDNESKRFLRLKFNYRIKEKEFGY